VLIIPQPNYPYSAAGKMTGRIRTPVFFGQKWYPMTLRPALPYAFGIAVWYSVVLTIDQKARGSDAGKFYTI
jgi:hypothetical protein